MGIQQLDTVADLTLDLTDASAIERALDKLNGQLGAEIFQAGIDIVGIFDPTPTSDVVGGLFSLFRGDFVGAGLSAVSAIPYVGDLVGKSAKMAKLMAKVNKLFNKFKAIRSRLRLLQAAGAKISPKTLALVKKLEALEAKWKKMMKDAEDKLKNLFSKKKKAKKDVEDGKKAADDANTADCVKKLPKGKKGGSYDSIKGEKGMEAHHMPAQSTYKGQMPAGRGPAINMPIEDHKLTASWGSSKASQAYRDMQQQLIEQGNWREAMQMDIDNIRELFGDKYDEGIQEMLNYMDELDLEAY